MSAPKATPVEQKKGEVNELRTLLRAVNSDKNAGKKKRDVVKKVRYPLNNMTLNMTVTHVCLFGGAINSSSKVSQAAALRGGGWD